MPPVARVGDRTFGICFAHSPTPFIGGGTIIVGDPHTFANGQQVARIDDLVRADCGHFSGIITGSPTTNATGIPVARLGDRVEQGPYKATIVTASPDTFADG